MLLATLPGGMVMMLNVVEVEEVKEVVEMKSTYLHQK
jgi:hypothetical protein